MKKNRMMVWILATCMALVSCTGSPAGDQRTQPDQALVQPIQVTDHKMIKNSGRYCWTVVSVSNAGKPLKAVEIVVDLYDATGHLIGTGSEFVRNLSAGGSTTAEVASEFSGEVESYRVRIGDVYYH